MDRILKVLNNRWTITLVSTMVGIIVGLYITSYFETEKLLKSKENAIAQVSAELLENKQLLQNHHQVMEVKYRDLSNLLEYLNKDMELVVHRDSLDGFKNKTQLIFKFSNYEVLTKQKVKVRGELNLNFESDLITRELSHIVWDSYKQMDYMSVTSFNCLTDVEALYTLQGEVNRTNAKWKDVFFQGTFIVDPNIKRDFMSLWKQLITKQKLLLDMYELRDDIMKECE